MYGDAEGALKRILELVDTCPKELQQKCFEILLTGYAQHELGVKGSGRGTGEPVRPPPPKSSEPPPKESEIPAAVLPRFKNAARRVGVTLASLEALFDFSVDPFALYALSLSGKTNADKTRQAALLAASRSYFATGTWSADWQEVKALCVDHNCYTGNNHATNLKVGVGALFKSVNPGSAVELSSDGIKEAEKLLKGLAEGGGQ